ncbi:MAG TPA: histidine phosphatase family protein [Trinickia sp.]|jgi:alpha-ribazole phosphatase|nr:histidine phosphatase family protein [Trinickia sp.]
MDLVLIRHPAPAIDAGVCYGRRDVPLAGDAPAAADALFVRLAATDAPLPQALWTSPLMRCASVAALLARRFAISRTVDARLQEMDFGAWEGVRWDAIDRAELDAWAADLHRARVHGGESVAQCAARVGEWLGAWRASCEASAVSCTHVVTHAGVMRIVASLTLGVPLEVLLSWPLEMGALVWLRRESASRAWRLVRWNG